MKQNRSARCHGPTPSIKFACSFVTIRYHDTYFTSINMLNSIKEVFLLHLFPCDVPFSKNQPECECEKLWITDDRQ